MKKIKSKTNHTTGTNNQLGRSGNDRDYLYQARAVKDFQGTVNSVKWNPRIKGLELLRRSKQNQTAGKYVSSLIKCRFPATEFLPSWNIRLNSSHQGFRLFLRVFATPDGRPSSWFLIGEGGKPFDDPKAKTEVPGWGSTRIDYVDLNKPAVAFQYRVDLFDSNPHDENLPPALCRFHVHYSGQGSTSNSRRTKPHPIRNSRHLKVPYRSQLTVEAEKLRNIICCPTSLSMVLEYNGINYPTLNICKEVYDNRYKIYGVWPHVSQVAFQYGLSGHIDRFRTHHDVYDYLDTGHPIIASIRVGDGELRGAKYGKSNGHIIVIVGYRKDGSYIVNDPASSGKKGREIDYLAEDMEKVWLDKGGVAVLVKPEK